MYAKTKKLRIIFLLVLLTLLLAVVLGLYFYQPNGIATGAQYV